MYHLSLLLGAVSTVALAAAVTADDFSGNHHFGDSRAATILELYGAEGGVGQLHRGLRILAENADDDSILL